MCARARSRVEIIGRENKFPKLLATWSGRDTPRDEHSKVGAEECLVWRSRGVLLTVGNLNGSAWLSGVLLHPRACCCRNDRVSFCKITAGRSRRLLGNGLTFSGLIDFF